MHRELLGSLAAASLLAALACTSGGDGAKGGDSAAIAAAAPAPCDSTAIPTGITVPDGFCVTVFADSLGHARHIVVATDGSVFVNTWSGRYFGDSPVKPGGFLVALRDTTRDGRADVVQRFGETSEAKGTGGTGIAIHDGKLYAEAGSRIVRFPLGGGSLSPAGTGEVVVSNLPLTGDHPQHPIAIHSSGALYVSSGSASNSCQIKERTLESKGREPCAELATRAGVWRYDANATNQRFSAAERFATGIRNPVGITIGPDGALYTTMHGRDQLAENWPKLYTPEQGQEQPGEEFMRVEQGDDFGWPHCYYDTVQQKLVLAPEYGGDGGTEVGLCADKKPPLASFPAHWAPNAVAFHTGTQLPERYRGGIFVAFHGSWNRTPGPQEGYNVTFLPLADGRPAGPHEVFAQGFPGGTVQPDRARYRPSGVAVGPDGAIYVTDDRVGRVWRITYGGRN